jgi:hypothetical protein
VYLQPNACILFSGESVRWSRLLRFMAARTASA